MNEFVKLLDEVKDMNGLLSWMDNNIDYYPSTKPVLYNEEDVIKYKKGHCWELTSFVAKAAKHFGHTDINTVYFENKTQSTTHSTVYYKDETDKTTPYKWFEWSWYMYAGIKSFKTKELCEGFILKKARSKYGKIKVSVTHSHISGKIKTDSYYDVLTKNLSELS